MNDDLFEMLQAAYRRGVDFACENLQTPDDDYTKLWEFVPKAAYDYADKTTSALTNTSGDDEAGSTKPEVWEWLETEVSAIDTWYRGSPSYEHDAGWMKDEIFKLIKHGKEAFSKNPEANSRLLRQMAHEGLPKWALDELESKDAEIKRLQSARPQSAAVRDEWQLMPKEPTAEMLEAAMKADQDGGSASMKTIWMVMWGAALHSTQEG